MVPQYSLAGSARKASIMTVPLLYTAELDLAAEDMESFKQWYAFRHAPDVYQAGFQTCTCYQAEQGDMNFLDIYEMPDWSIFETARYQGMQGRDPYMAPLMAKRRNKAHTIYRQHLIAPDIAGAWFDTDWVTVTRFTAPAELDPEIAAFLAERMIAPADDGGPARTRYACRTKDHPRNPTFRPRCMVVMEWPHRPPAGDDLVLSLGSRFGDAFSDATVFVGRRVYPWPDRPGA